MSKSDVFNKKLAADDAAKNGLADDALKGIVGGVGEATGKKTDRASGKYVGGPERTEADESTDKESIIGRLGR